MTVLDKGSTKGQDGNSTCKPAEGDGVEPSGGETNKDNSTAVKGVNRRVIGFALVALGVLNSLFKVKAGITETSWLNIILIGAGAVIFFSAMRRGRDI